MEGDHVTADWDFATLGAPNVFPRRVRDAGLPRRLYRQSKWRLRGRLTRWMTVQAYRQMNAHYKRYGDADAARAVIGTWELVAAAEQADTRGIINNAPAEIDGFPEWIHLTDEEVAKCARTAVRAVGKHWRPTFIDTCILGGQVSRRGPKFTSKDYLQVRHMTQSKAAAALGCSIATVKRLRARAAAAGSAFRAAVLEHARRQRRTYAPVVHWYQLTRTWGDFAPVGHTMPTTGEGESPP